MGRKARQMEQARARKKAAKKAPGVESLARAIRQRALAQEGEIAEGLVSLAVRGNLSAVKVMLDVLREEDVSAAAGVRRVNHSRKTLAALEKDCVLTEGL